MVAYAGSQFWVELVVWRKSVFVSCGFVIRSWSQFLMRGLCVFLLSRVVIFAMIRVVSEVELVGLCCLFLALWYTPLLLITVSSGEPLRPGTVVQER